MSNVIDNALCEFEKVIDRIANYDKPIIPEKKVKLFTEFLRVYRQFESDTQEIVQSDNSVDERHAMLQRHLASGSHLNDTKDTQPVYAVSTKYVTPDINEIQHREQDGSFTNYVLLKDRE